MDFTSKITFLIDQKGKIYYNPCDLFDHHEDLIEDNGINEYYVCRLVYNPDGDESFCGIKGVEASCNVLWDATPFELKNTHLNAIENWLKDYESMVTYEKTNYNSDSTTRDGRDIQVMNNLIMAGAEGLAIQTPVSNKYFEEEDEKEAEQQEIQDKIDKINEIDSQILDKVISTETEVIKVDETKSKINYKYNVDMMRYIELSEQLAHESGCPSSMYWTMAGGIIDSLMRRITERACELEDEALLGHLLRLGYAEKIEEETDEKERI